MKIETIKLKQPEAFQQTSHFNRKCRPHILHFSMKLGQTSTQQVILFLSQGPQPTKIQVVFPGGRNGKFPMPLSMHSWPTKASKYIIPHESNLLRILLILLVTLLVSTWISWQLTFLPQGSFHSSGSVPSSASQIQLMLKDGPQDFLEMELYVTRIKWPKIPG